MYYPYLRGKQFELLALRDFSNENQNNSKIIPIIEPVKQQVNGLNMALSTMRMNGMRFAVILNPKEGDFRHPNVNNNILRSLSSLDNDRESWIPAYIYNNHPQSILEHANENNLENLMIVFPSGADVNNDELMTFLREGQISYVVSANLGDSRSARGRLRNLGKTIICLEDRFQERPKNADYANPDDELFSEDFAYYKVDGMNGFSDYTPLSKEYSEGGALPKAIAIHLTYRKSEDQIYVHHFVSVSNYDQTNIRGKFFEAASKVSSFYEKIDFKTSAVKELIDRAMSEDGFPGLGYLKKLSIKNHLELMNHIL